MIRIAVDAMGGDYAPREVVNGAVIAAREYSVAIQLVGPPEAVEAELKRHDTTGLDITIIPASEVVAMDEKPTAWLRLGLREPLLSPFSLVLAGWRMSSARRLPA
jgi:glycerol-3-phosphate acyltransferase PlsX